MASQTCVCVQAVTDARTDSTDLNTNFGLSARTHKNINVFQIWMWSLRSNVMTVVKKILKRVFVVDAGEYPGVGSGA